MMPAREEAEPPAVGHPENQSHAYQLGRLILVFWATGIVFLLLILLFVAWLTVLKANQRFFELAILPSAGLLVLMSVALMIMAARAPLIKRFRLALIWTGVAAAGIPISAVLHNVVYGLVITLFGEKAWGGTAGREGGDEPVFFLLALIVFPLALITSYISGMVIYLKRRGGVVATQTDLSH